MLTPEQRIDRELLKLEHNLDVFGAQRGLIWNKETEQWERHFKSLYAQ